MKPTKTIPTFKNENEEREFWENNDTLDYFDESKVKMVRFPNLKKTTKSYLYSSSFRNDKIALINYFLRLAKRLKA